ncbi:MAG: hypothetical protein GX158_11195 [Bacteroidales bacterium]|jgi:hypothetical protein|nr:hypothetical protein [Bacteroidales bacterium]
MDLPAKYDRLATGMVSGFLLPLVTGLAIFFFSADHPHFSEWIRKITDAGIAVKLVTLCVVPNVLIFMLFNHYDMLKAARGVLGLTIAWAFLVFAIKFLA